MKTFFEWIKAILIAVVIGILILTFIKPIVVQQSSMEPTFYEGDYIFLSRQAYTLFGHVERGDVVVFHTELKDDEAHDKNLIKRVIGLPGDEVEIKEGYVYLNGEKQEETYVAEAGMSGEMEKIVVPEGYLFAMGDNRIASLDSRDVRIGCVSQEEILGKVIIRIFPFDRFKTF
ncbi:MAG: signal peptidase I [Firmicutes bacterium]|jgi:signal peptidase I|nr:signal peptidase I [Bacillota bacterium]